MDCTKQRITEQIRDMIRAYEKSTVTKWGTLLWDLPVQQRLRS